MRLRHSHGYKLTYLMSQLLLLAHVTLRGVAELEECRSRIRGADCASIQTSTMYISSTCKYSNSDPLYIRPVQSSSPKKSKNVSLRLSLIPVFTPLALAPAGAITTYSPETRTLTLELPPSARAWLNFSGTSDISSDT